MQSSIGQEAEKSESTRESEGQIQRLVGSRKEGHRFEELCRRWRGKGVCFCDDGRWERKQLGSLPASLS